jgi:hypothetical protein
MTDKGRALFGFAPDTRLDYAALNSRVHPADRAARDAAIKRALETEGEYATEYRALLPDGTLRWASYAGACAGRPEFFPRTAQKEKPHEKAAVVLPLCRLVSS